MKIKLAWIGRTKEPAVQSLVAEYTKRTSRYVQIETQEFTSEESLVRWVEKIVPRPYFVALERKGKEITSEELAGLIGSHQDRGTQAMLFAVGPANGWATETLAAAQYQFSMGRLTLPHELALVLLTEQIYRAYTILKNHPYHVGH